MHHSHNALENLIIIEGHYSLPFVILSVLFVIVGTYTSLTMQERVNENSFFPKSVWFFLSSFALGFGIWAMHYMGMFAIELPILIEFKPLFTLLSLVPILVAAYISIYLCYKKNKSRKYRLISSTVLALGVLGTHFIGMVSIVSEAYHDYKFYSMVIALIPSFSAFYIFYRTRYLLEISFAKIGISIITGILFSSTHYIAMGAMKFYIENPYSLLDEVVPIVFRNGSTILLTSVLVFILLILIISSFADKYVQHKAEHYDLLTKLPNIRMFEISIEQKKFAYMAVFQIKDLHEDFDSLTYLQREHVIKEIAACIEKSKSQESTLFRTDYYQFVLLSTKTDKKFLNALLHIQQRLNQKFSLINGEKLDSQYICIYINNKQNISVENIYNAIKANLLKVTYQNQMLDFDHLSNEPSLEQEILTDIPKAINNNELFLVYQPKFNVLSNKFNHVEALIRWRHPEKGLISPGIFIPIVEKSAYIFDLTDWIIKQVCKQLNEWDKQNINVREVSINIPGNYVTKDRLKQTLLKQISTYNLSSNRIELEITETSYVSNIDEASKAVMDFRKLGFLVAIDDFGTGVSSLSYLKRLPVTTLKIDKSFVDGVPHSKKDAEILKGIVYLANTLQLNIIIEGVEQEEQAMFIKQNFENVLIQGYYFSKPLSGMDINKFYIEIEQQNGKAITVDI